MPGDPAKLTESAVVTIRIHRDLEFNEKLNQLLEEYSDVICESLLDTGTHYHTHTVCVKRTEGEGNA